MRSDASVLTITVVSAIFLAIKGCDKTISFIDLSLPDSPHWFLAVTVYTPESALAILFIVKEESVFGSRFPFFFHIYPEIIAPVP